MTSMVDRVAEIRAKQSTPASLAYVPKILVARPSAIELLAVFVDHWGLDHYDPPEETMNIVRQLVALAVSESRDLQAIDEQHS